MRTAKPRLDVRHVLGRMFAQALGLAMIAACAAAGYLIFALTVDTRAQSDAIRVINGIGGIFSGLFDTNDVVMMTILPGLIVGVLSLGGMYLWNKRG